MCVLVISPILLVVPYIMVEANVKIFLQAQRNIEPAQLLNVAFNVNHIEDPQVQKYQP